MRERDNRTPVGKFRALRRAKTRQREADERAAAISGTSKAAPDGGPANILNKRFDETYLQWKSRLARLRAIERDRSVPLVTPEAEQHGEYSQSDVLHEETNTRIVTKRNLTVSPIELLHRRGTITEDQFKAAIEIEMAHRITTGDVAIRSASLEARVDNSGAARDVLFERLAMVRIERMYSRWRVFIPVPRQMILDMVLGRGGIAKIAMSYGVGYRRAKKLLETALDSWIAIREDVVKTVDERDLEAAHYRLGEGKYV